MTESVEMYLVMTALLRSAPEHPVAVSLLAGKLGVTQVSAIEMCHKLSERGMLTYQPYKGVTLTPDGEEQAQAILSRRRLWVIFLVENLGIEPAEADELACQMEHITSERLVNALRAFVERVPERTLTTESAAQLLSQWSAGQHGRVAAITAEPAVAVFLHSQGLAVGTEVHILATGSDQAVLLDVGGRTLTLAPALADQIRLARTDQWHTTRHATWSRCSSFWACMRGEVCVCELVER